MAFATSGSAFGMKPATTNLFGTTATPAAQPTTGLFGATTPAAGATQPTNNIFGSFGQNQQQQQQQQQPTVGAFGQPQQQQQQPTTNIFGQAQTAQPAATTNLFGQTQTQQQPAATTNIFGQPQQQQPAAGAAAPATTTNIFGMPQTQAQPQQQPAQTNPFGGGGLFGSTNTTNTQQQNQQVQPNPFGGGQTGGGFSFITGQQQQPATTNNLFGSTTTAANPLQAQTNTNPFGGTTAGAFGGGMFGAKPAQPQQTAFGQTTAAAPAGPPPFTKATKFNDLPDDVKKTLEQIESYIQGRVQLSKDLQQRKLGEEPTKGKDAIRTLHQELISTATLIRNDLNLTEDVKTKVEQSVEDTIVATRIIEGVRNPQSGNTYLKDHAAFPLEYFTRIADQMKERLAWYQATIEQIERKLASATTSAVTPQSISATLNAQHQTFVTLAGKTAAVEAEMAKIKAFYTQTWRAKTGSVRDPFNDVVKPEPVGDFGLSGLNVR